MKIDYRFDAHLQQSIAYDGQKQVGFCQFDAKDNTWMIRTTHVLDEYSGQGIAKKLVLMIEQEAQKQGINLQSTCWYATKILGL